MPAKPPSDKPGWRGSGADQPRSWSAGKKGSGWAKKKDRQYERGRRRHRTRIAAGSLLFIVLIGAFIWYLIQIRPMTPFIVAKVIDYQAPIPPNAWAEEDVELFGDLDQEHEHAKILNYSKVPWESKDTWESKEIALNNLSVQLKQARKSPGGPGKDVIIVYLSMHGVVDGEGKACLLPPGATPSNTGTWLPVSELLDVLKDKERKEIKKLLILDSNRMDANWGLGLLYNSFAERLEDEVKRANTEDPNLIVLNSASPGQIGWAAPELGGSVFAYFLWRGLKGAADEESTAGNEDNKVSLGELYGYLKINVDNWVRGTRADRQVPLLLPRGVEDKNDFPLVFTSRPGLPPLIPENKDDPGWEDFRKRQEELDKRWKEVDAWWLKHEELSTHRHAGLNETNPYRLSPLKWEEFQHKLLRLEQLAEAGNAYVTEFDKINEKLISLTAEPEKEGLQKDWKQWAGKNTLVYNLPLARHLRQWSKTEIEEAQKRKGEAKGKLEAHLALRAKQGESEASREKTPQGPKPEDAPQTPAADADSGTKPDNSPEETNGGNDSKQAADEAAEPGEPKKAAEGPGPESAGRPQCAYLDAAEAAWEWSIQPARQPDELKVVLEFVDQADVGSETDKIELHFLRMLAAHLDSEVWDKGAYHVRRALQVRRLAEEAAAPADERVHYWVRRLVNEADNNRRLAEDKLFVGSPTKLEEADRLWKEAAENGTVGNYQEAAKRAETVTRAFETRDLAWAKTPYLAQWLLARLHEDNTTDLKDSGEDLKQLDELIEMTSQLAAELDRSLESGEPEEAGFSPADLEQLEKSLKAVSERLDKLEKAFHKECRGLLQPAGEHAEKLRRIATVLALPLVTGGDRSALRKKYLQIAKDIKTSEAEGLPGQERNGDASEAASRWLERLRLRDGKPVEHPALIILRRAESHADQGRSAATPEGLHKQGERVRQLLAGVRDKADKWLEKTKDQLTSNEQPGQSSAAWRAAPRVHLSRADRLVRASAAFLGGQPSSMIPNEDPAGRLRLLDLHYLLLWHAERTLDDFWGPKPGEREPSFFKKAAQGYLATAGTLCRRLCEKESSVRYREVADLLDKRELSVNNDVVKPRAPESTDLDKTDTQKEQTISFTVADHLPEGEAAFYLESPPEDAGKPGDLFPILRTADQEEPDLRRRAIRFRERPFQEKPELQYWIPVTAELKETRRLNAVVLFRGHKRDCNIDFPEGTEIVFQPDYDDPTTIRVSGEAKERKTIVFIFDCSGSMKDPVGGKEGNPRRLDAAKNALIQILLTRIDVGEGYRVGVMVYGAYTWQKPPGKYITTTGKHPSEDVEWVPRNQKPKLLTRQELSTICERLKEFGPQGFTPIYYAIIKAINESPKGGTIHIVVITDGVNTQITDDLPVGRIRDVIKWPSDVQAAINEYSRHPNQSVRLDILGFDLSQEEKNKRESLDRLTELAEDNRGDFSYADQPSTLEERLLESLAPVKYRVGSLPGDESSEPRELNEYCIIPRPNRPRWYEVGLEDPKQATPVKVELWGGEKLELEFREGQRRLVHRRYERPRADFRDVPSRAPRFHVVAHVPDPVADRVTFDLSIQNKEAEKFSPRPREVWVRIRPVPAPIGTKSLPVYTFYDPNYKSGCPVPVLSCVARNWPKDATRAEIELWFRLQDGTRPDGRFSLESLEGRPRRIEGIEGLEGVTFKADFERDEDQDQDVVTVIETHPDADSLYALKVEMKPSPSKVIHRYCPETRPPSIRHFFHFDEAHQPGTRKDYKVLVTTHESFKKGALSIIQPIEPDPLEVLVGNR